MVDGNVNLEGTKGVIRIRKSKDRQGNDQTQGEKRQTIYKTLCRKQRFEQHYSKPKVTLLLLSNTR
jgi:hypothetical protein